MRTHVSDESLMDVLEGAGGSEATGHLGSCAECRERLQEARAGMALAREADVPEPSPLYWETFHREVGRRLAGSPGPWRRVLWPAVAALAAGLWFLALPRPEPEAPAPPAALLQAWSALPGPDEDPGLPLLRAVAAQLEPEAECAPLEECVAELSDDESGALAEMLRGEVPWRES